MTMQHLHPAEQYADNASHEYSRTESTPTVLEAHHIDLAYRSGGAATQTVLRDFSLTLRAREIVAILGPSGVGKSTLLRVLAGLQRPDSGNVTTLGAAMSKPHPKVGVVFQDACLLPWNNVSGNVGIGLSFANQPRTTAAERNARVAAALSEVGLDGTADQMPSALSGGMAQRVALARCLVRRPSILLLDEPFAALDAATRTAMQSLLLQIARHHNSAAVLVTHDIDEALRVADRVLLLQGKPATLAAKWTLPHDVTGALRPVSTTLREQIVTALTPPDTTATLPEPTQVYA